MKIIQAYKEIFFVFFISSLCYASSFPEDKTSEFSDKASEKASLYSNPSTDKILDARGSSASSTSDEDILPQPLPVTLKSSNYNAEEVITAIKEEAAKPFYTNDHLSVDGDIFLAIKAGDDRITELFKTALNKFKKPTGISWSCWPIWSSDKSKIRIHVSNPK